jgi:uncharacterized DUF497 family protein
MLSFEWDDAKAKSNIARHGISFVDASAVFNDPFALDIEERSMEYGEIRRRIFGLDNGRVLTVIYTERGESISIISARKATRWESREYNDARW